MRSNQETDLRNLLGLSPSFDFSGLTDFQIEVTHGRVCQKKSVKTLWEETGKSIGYLDMLIRKTLRALRS